MDFVCVCMCISSTQQGVAATQLQVWEQAASAQRALGTWCTDVGGWVSRLGSCDVQWELFGTLIEGNCETSIFHFIRNWT